MSTNATNAVKKTWDKNIQDEIRFWRHIFETKGFRWPEEYRERQNPQRSLQTYITETFDVPDGMPVRILDVGAGPLTPLGKV